MKALLRLPALWVTLYCGCLTVPVQANDYLQQFIDPEDGHLDASSWLLDNAYGFLPVPMIISEPAVGYGLGITAVFFHETEEQKTNRLLREGGDKIVKPSLPTRMSFVGLLGTENGTKAWLGGHFGVYGDDRYRYTGAAGQFDLNMTFYGDRNDLPWDFNMAIDLLLQDLKIRLGDSDFFAGAKFVYSNNDVQLEGIGNTDGASLPPEFAALLGKEIASTGVGLTLSYDSRDTLWGAEQGNDSLVEAVKYGEWLGAENDFISYKLYSHQYIVLTPTLFAGLRGDYRTISGDAPFYQKPYIDLMGIPVMRYQGDHTLVGEVNLRWMPHPRWSLISFAGVGVAADSFDELSDASSKVSKGVGFRYLLAKAMRLHSGIDVAWGPEETVVYIKTGIGW